MNSLKFEFLFSFGFEHKDFLIQWSIQIIRYHWSLVTNKCLSYHSFCLIEDFTGAYPTLFDKSLDKHFVGFDSIYEHSRRDKVVLKTFSSIFFFCFDFRLEFLGVSWWISASRDISTSFYSGICTSNRTISFEDFLSFSDAFAMVRRQKQDVVSNIVSLYHRFTDEFFINSKENLFSSNLVQIRDTFEHQRQRTFATSNFFFLFFSSSFRFDNEKIYADAERCLKILDNQLKTTEQRFLIGEK